MARVMVVVKEHVKVLVLEDVRMGVAKLAQLAAMEVVKDHVRECRSIKFNRIGSIITCIKMTTI